MIRGRRRAGPPALRGLNPALYGRLTSRIGPVQVAAEGVPATYGTPRLDLKKGRLRSAFVDPGEAYTTCCPYCNDSRFRLWVHHLWCTPDPLTGDPMRHLAHCYNDDCLHAHYADFEARVFDPENAGTRRRRENMMAMRVLPGLPVAAVEGPPALPGSCVPLDELPPHHPAVAYLRRRGFDPSELARDRDVLLCTRGEGRSSSLTGRIVVPVTARHVRVGWQARYAGDLDWKAAGIPKYFTMPGFKKGQHLYGADLASGHSPRLVAVVEGVTDAWAAGPSAVAALGKSISEHQQALLSSWAGRGGLCLLCLDPGAWTDEVAPQNRERAAAKHAALVDRLRHNFDGRLVEVALPPGTDPGSLGQEALRTIFAAQAKAAGFAISEFERG